MSFKLYLVQILLLAFSFLFFGCASGKINKTDEQSEQNLIKTVVVVPFRAISPDNSRGSTRCPLSGVIFRTCGILEDAENALHDAFSKKAQVFKDITWISSRPPVGITSESFQAWNIATLQKIGSDLKADAVLAGHVFCFRERVGYPYSVEKPASAAFGIYLVRTSDGAIIWKGIYDYTQQSLFENLLQISKFVRGHGQWLTAEELAEEGLDDLLKTFPARNAGSE